MPKVDYKVISVRLVSKLNAIAFELDSIAKESVSADCSFMSRDLLERFNLHPDGREWLIPDFDDISKANDRLGVVLARLKFCTPSERDKLLDDALELHSRLNELLCIYGAFV